MSFQAVSKPKPKHRPIRSPLPATILAQNQPTATSAPATAPPTATATPIAASTSASSGGVMGLFSGLMGSFSAGDSKSSSAPAFAFDTFTYTSPLLPGSSSAVSTTSTPLDMDAIRVNSIEFAQLIRDGTLASWDAAIDLVSLLGYERIDTAHRYSALDPLAAAAAAPKPDRKVGPGSSGLESSLARVAAGPNVPLFIEWLALKPPSLYKDKNDAGSVSQLDYSYDDRLLRVFMRTGSKSYLNAPVPGATLTDAESQLLPLCCGGGHTQKLLRGRRPIIPLMYILERATPSLLHSVLELPEKEYSFTEQINSDAGQEVLLSLMHNTRHPFGETAALALVERTRDLNRVFEIVIDSRVCQETLLLAAVRNNRSTVVRSILGRCLTRDVHYGFVSPQTQRTARQEIESTFFLSHNHVQQHSEVRPIIRHEFKIVDTRVRALVNKYLDTVLHALPIELIPIITGYYFIPMYEHYASSKIDNALNVERPIDWVAHQAKQAQLQAAALARQRIVRGAGGGNAAAGVNAMMNNANNNNAAAAGRGGAAAAAVAFNPNANANANANAAGFQLPDELQALFFEQPHVSAFMHAERARHQTELQIITALQPEMWAFSNQLQGL